MLVDLFLHAGIQHAVGRTVDDQAHLTGVQLHLVDHFRDPGHRLDAPAGTVGNEQHGVHMGQRTPGHMLQTGFVVHYQIAVIFGILVDLGLENAVDVAIAALALGPAHDNHVEIVLLDEGVAELHVRIVGLGHAGGDGPLQLGLGHFLPDGAQRNALLHTQNFVQVGVCVCVHHQDGSLLLLAEIVHDHAAGGGLAYAAFTGDRNGMGCCHNDPTPLEKPEYTSTAPKGGRRCFRC